MHKAVRLLHEIRAEMLGAGTHLDVIEKIWNKIEDYFASATDTEQDDVCEEWSVNIHDENAIAVIRGPKVEMDKRAEGLRKEQP